MVIIKKPNVNKYRQVEEERMRKRKGVGKEKQEGGEEESRERRGRERDRSDPSSLYWVIFFGDGRCSWSRSPRRDIRSTALTRKAVCFM